MQDKLAFRFEANESSKSSKKSSKSSKKSSKSSTKHPSTTTGTGPMVATDKKSGSTKVKGPEKVTPDQNEQLDGMIHGQPSKRMKTSPATGVQECEKKDASDDTIDGSDAKELTMETVNIM